MYAHQGNDPNADPSSEGVEQTLEENKSAEQLSEREGWQADLSAAQKLWREVNLNNYSVKVRRVCFCAPAADNNVQVEVVNGRVAQARGSLTEGVYDVPVSAESLHDWYTVQGMFEVIDANLTADRVVVEYDEGTGFPTYVLLDYHVISSEEGDIFEMWDFTASLTP